MSEDTRLIIGGVTLLIAVACIIMGIACRSRFIARYEAAKLIEGVGLLCFLTGVVVFPTD